MAARAPGPPNRRTAERAVEQSTRFSKAKRRLTPEGQRVLDEQVRAILSEPLRGDPKVGALRGVRVAKFKIGPMQLLLAYQLDARRNVVELLDVGPHENFYRDLEGYLGRR